MESKYLLTKKSSINKKMNIDYTKNINGNFKAAKRKNNSMAHFDTVPSKKCKILTSKKHNNCNKSNNKNYVSLMQNNNHNHREYVSLQQNSSNNNKNINNNNTNNYKRQQASGDETTMNTKLEEQRQSLPIYKCREQFVHVVNENDTVLIMGETGSGKTTQMPQYLLAAGYGKHGVICVTQPRRVAAITIAKRVAQEQNCQLGGLVGYTVRFEDCTSDQTRIRYMTDGSLLREALCDRLLSSYSVLILDEVHERTISSDVLLGIAKEAQKRRRAEGSPPLKLVITSATMDIDNFSEYFKVPGMYLEGRTHPIRYFHTLKKHQEYLNAVLSTISNVHNNLPIDHDVLVFLTGQEEIELMAHQIRQLVKNMKESKAVRVFPMYAQLPQHKQMDCFIPTPANTRKIILSTNIAETSVTIPGIRCVIDSGFVKRRIYNPESSLDVLRVVRISQAQAFQRSGRAGREAPGICYRTYTLDEMEQFDKMPEPEILRSNISCTVLQLLALGIDCKNFDFLDKPSPQTINNAYDILSTLGAIKKVPTSGNYEMTGLGQRMVQFPLDPQYSKLLLTAPVYGCLEEMLSLVAMLSSENVFVTTTEKRELANLAHGKFSSKSGDHLTLLNVFKAFDKTEKMKTWCHDNFLNIRNLTYAREVRQQLAEIAERLKLNMKSCGSNEDQVKKCLLAGLVDNIAKLQRDNTYYTLSGRQTTRLHPSSVFHSKYKPKFLVYTDIVHTERIFLRQVTEINPEWISEVVPNYPYLNRVTEN